MSGRVVIAGTQSGVGKTTVVAGLLRSLSKKGITVKPFKVGPDFIDPGYHMLACGMPSSNLDVWLTSERAVADIFGKGSAGKLAVVEGVMGLFDGGDGGVGSTAQVAKIIGAPAILVVDASAMAQSAGALLRGFKEHDREIKVAGVIFNNVAGPGHAGVLDSEAKKLGLEVVGSLGRMGESLEERHLGLVPTAERATRLDLAVEKISREIDERLDIEKLLDIAGHATASEPGPDSTCDGEPRVADGNVPVIAVAYDEAFSFYYRENLDLLAERAHLVEFSPLNDPLPPEADGFYFGGGYPEVFAGRLAANKRMREALKQAIGEGAPTYAECGGLIYIGTEIEDFDGGRYPMVAALDISCKMDNKLTLGYREVEALADTPLFAKGASLRGHEFHHSKIARCGENARAYRNVDSGVFEGFAKGNILASYIHLHFAADTSMVRRFVDSCDKARSAMYS